MPATRRCTAIVCVVAFSLAATIATAAERGFSFVAIGDVPYRVPEQLAPFDRLIQRVNTLAPAFTVHVGDIKGGVNPCVDEVYESMLAAFDRFENPLVYTPGDNEWTDCHRKSAGAYDPLERLDKLRQLFFPGKGSLGRTRMSLTHQSDEPRFARYVENVRWEREQVIFVTLHIVGSNNNLQRDATALAEYAARNAANLAWLDASFGFASNSDAKAVVLFFHGDPQWELEGQEDRRSGFSDTVREIKRHVRGFGKPVLIVHGDKHRFVVDKPLYENRRLIYNATRLMVFGDTEVHGVRVSVNPDDPEVFSFRTITIDQSVR